MRSIRELVTVGVLPKLKNHSECPSSATSNTTYHRSAAAVLAAPGPTESSVRCEEPSRWRQAQCQGKRGRTSTASVFFFLPFFKPLVLNVLLLALETSTSLNHCYLTFGAFEAFNSSQRSTKGSTEQRRALFPDKEGREPELQLTPELIKDGRLRFSSKSAVGPLFKSTLMLWLLLF